jgi:hypothetical protein
MALTFTTGMTSISTADSVTNWAAYRITGTGGAPSASLENTIYIQGTGSIAGKMAGNNWDSGLIYDYYTANGNTVLNLSTTGNEMIGIWVLVSTPAVFLTRQNGGGYLILQSSTETGTTAPTKYAKFYLAGSDVGYGGWQFYLLDTRKTASTTAGGWVAGTDLAITRRIGFGGVNVASVGTVKSDNMWVDASWYGRPIYSVIGDGSTTASWSDLINDSASAVNGLIRDLGGVYQLSCGLRIGSASQSATTTFVDATSKQFIFKRYTYYQGGNVDAVTYSDIYKLEGVGAASFRTSITIGSVVGTGDNRQGVLGGAIQTPDTTNVPWSIDFQTDKTDLSAVKLYGLSIFGATGGVLLDNDSGASETSMISCTLNNCGLIDSGSTGNGAEILNCNVIDPFGGTSANRGLTFYSSHHIKKINFITTGTPATQHMAYLPSTPPYSVPFDAIIYYGDYSSGTLWHGEVSVSSSSDVELAKSNNANPDATEFEKTGGYTGTITATASFVLTITDTISGTDVTIVNSSTRTELKHEVSSGADITYTHSGGETVDILIIHIDYDPNLSSIFSLTLPNSNSTIKVQQIDDPNYVNP